jgi:hypothetical protein
MHPNRLKAELQTEPPWESATHPDPQGQPKILRLVTSSFTKTPVANSQTETSNPPVLLSGKLLTRRYAFS